MEPSVQPINTHLQVDGLGTTDQPLASEPGTLVMPSNPGVIYNEIYQQNRWGQGSGAGSTFENTALYHAFLADFLRANDIQSMVDVGCGDWQSMQYFDLTGIDYTGFDVASVVVDRNNAQYANDHIRFVLADAAGSELPTADLVVIKDVLQHWPTPRIQAFLPQLSRFKFALITNCAEPRAELNKDISDGRFRPLDLTLPPFNQNLKHVFTFTNRLKPEEQNRIKWVKYVYLYDRDGVAQLPMVWSG